jgi:hypothetical protein
MTGPEVISGEVVATVPPAAGDVAPEATTAAIERAAEAALAAPDAPGRDEFLALAAMARILSLSGAAPKAVRENPYVAFHVALVGRDFGLSPSAALELIDVIEGKRGSGEYRLSLSPQLMNGQIRRLGLGRIVPVERTNERCVVRAVGPDGQPLGPDVDFTWEDARMAGLVGEECEPGRHVKRTRTSGSRSWEACGCNQGYVTYPRRMLWWRASGFAVDDYFPEAGLGLYSAEALGAMVDENGRAIDPATVELPEGYEPAALGGGGRRDDDVDDGGYRPADADDLLALQVDMAALPEGVRADLRQAWKGHQALGKWRPGFLPVELLQTARAMVNAHWARANKAGARIEVERLAVVERVVNGIAYGLSCALGVPGGIAGPDSAAAPSEAQESAPGGEERVVHLMDALARSVDEAKAERQAARAADPLEGVIICGRGAPVTDEDRAAVAEAVEQMRAEAAAAAEDMPVQDRGELGQVSEPEPVDWTPIEVEVAEHVRAIAATVPPAVAKRIDADVKALHWRKVTDEIVDAGEPYVSIAPPDAPIDLRRMAVALIRYRAFAAGMDASALPER